MKALITLTLAALTQTSSLPAANLAIERNGSTITLQASADFQTWHSVTNLTSAGPQKFFRSSSADSIPLSFLYEPRQIRPITFFNSYYGHKGQSDPLVDPYPFQDDQGIRMYKASDGKLYNHQTLHSEYGLAMFNGYMNTTNLAYLARAEMYAQRLIETKIESRGAWFWPCEFPFQLRWWPDSDILQPPFYGALGQGNTLSLFLYLHQATGKALFLEAAHKTFAAFKLSPIAGEPWLIELDEEGYLWFEEYAGRIEKPQYVLNGHIFALFGVYDYYQQTRDPDAARLLEAAFLTVKRWYPWFRTPGWIVKYSRAVPVFNHNYQEPVIRLLRVCYSMTGDLFFADAAEELADDYPSFQYASPGTVFGGLTGVQFNQYGAVTNTLSSVASKAGVVWIGKRQSILNQPGTWLRIDTGTLSNYWVKEMPPVAVMNCIVQPIPFDPPRKITLTGIPPEYVFTTYDGRGKVLDSKTRSYSTNQTLLFDQRAFINSRLHVRIAEGEFAQYWLPVEVRTTRD